MGKAVYEDEVGFIESGHSAAAVICRTQQGNLHAGVLYRDGESPVALHLGWEDFLSTTWNWSRLWSTPDVAPERLRSIGTICRQVWRVFQEERAFPYGLTFGGSKFEASGRLLLSEQATGLTCATFVLAIFRAVDVDLVDEETWPVREDDDREFLAMVKQVPGSADLYWRMKREVDEGCKRIRPDEVIGSCACELPANFDDARSEADGVLEKLDSPML